MIAIVVPRSIHNFVWTSSTMAILATLCGAYYVTRVDKNAWYAYIMTPHELLCIGVGAHDRTPQCYDEWLGSKLRSERPSWKGRGGTHLTGPGGLLIPPCNKWWVSCANATSGLLEGL